MEKTDLIKNAILSKLPDAEVHVEDTMGDNNHFQATVISKEFEGKSLLEQHQLVYEPLNEALKDKVHAFSLKTLTPEQWARKAH
ncbi:MAG: BolA/IbaG family iron-sulfur metabolism protein [Deltaproteobacteria bacterium]|nr:BolA/IbaG family iron-sulfur metabolism protein [Deltaproteobacteria bacterium]